MFGLITGKYQKAKIILGCYKLVNKCKNEYLLNSVCVGGIADLIMRFETIRNLYLLVNKILVSIKFFSYFFGEVSTYMLHCCERALFNSRYKRMLLIFRLFAMNIR